MSYVVGFVPHEFVQSTAPLRPAVALRPLTLTVSPSTTDTTGATGAAKDNTLPVFVPPDKKDGAGSGAGLDTLANQPPAGGVDDKAALPGWVVPATLAFLAWRILK